MFPSSLALLRDLLNALMFLSNLTGFNSSPSPPDQRFAQRKGSFKVWKEKGLKWFSHFFSLSHYVMHYLFVSLSCFWVSLVLCFILFNMLLFVCFQFCFILFIYFFKRLKNQKNTKTVCVCILWYLCTLDGHWNKVSKLCIFCSLDGHLNA